MHALQYDQSAHSGHCATMQNIDSAHIVKNAYGLYNLSIGVGLAKVAGKV